MGGGNITTRGILFQTLVSVFDSLENEDWVSVCVEPLEEEIVDITWSKIVEGEPKRTKRRVTQVKSTENHFDISKIGTVLSDLISESTADKYELRLIGNLNSSAYSFVKKLINRKSFTTKTEKKFQDLKKVADKIEIKINPLDEGLFKMAIIGHLFKLASSQNWNYSYKVYECCADYLLGNKLSLSEKGKAETRDDYFNKIFQFLNICKEEVENAHEFYKKIIKTAEELCWLGKWEAWTNRILIDPPEIPSELYYSIDDFVTEIRQTRWPKELIKLEYSVNLFANMLYRAMDTFLKLSHVEGDMTVATCHFKTIGKHEDGSYLKLKRQHEKWHSTVIDYIEDADKALNWLVDEFCENIDSNYRNSKYFGYGNNIAKTFEEDEKKILLINHQIKYEDGTLSLSENMDFYRIYGKPLV